MGRPPKNKDGQEEKIQVDDKKQNLELALAEIEKNFGKGSIMRLTDAPIRTQVIPTGALSLDLALGVGGIPRGRVIEIYGPESAGKSTLTLSIVAEAQKLGGICAYVDAEHAMDPAYAKAMGVDIDNLLISQPDSGEQGLSIVETLVKSESCSLIIVDSVAALVPISELEGEMGDAQMGKQARLMSQALRKLTAIMAKTNTCVIFVNQLREKIGVMFGNPETTPGGKALKFYASIRIDIRRIESIKNGEEAIGNKVKAKVVKNKCAPPFRQCEFEILFGKGINSQADLINMAESVGVITKASANWYSYGADKIGHGIEQVQGYFNEHKEIEQEIKKKVLSLIGPDWNV